MSVVAFTRGGAGESLLLIHGIGSRRQVWDPLLPALTMQRDVIAVDLPGFNGTHVGDVTPTVAGYAGALAEWCVDQGIEQPHVAGHSLGGAIALELGNLGFAQSVTAFAPIGFWGRAGRAWCRGALSSLRRAAVPLQPLLPHLARSRPGRVAAAGMLYGQTHMLTADSVVEDSRAFLAAAAFDDVLASFGEYTFSPHRNLGLIPVNVVWGTRDALLPCITQSSEVSRRLPGARQVRVRSGGHVSFVDDPTLCAQVLLGRHAGCGCAVDVALR
ncbi:hypothetical protein CH306_25945 [Rhodococcus sp. 15-725-2-2b]|uniref:alpha/beta hydrolase n=1 Tax=unclassified Rhodococcus (in: high G+C Gram-positive bacteria) TaxID=192944 RepID=UPI000B9BEFCC|nr:MULTISPECIES: alpha/beta hydrolase [unclassified Rhodococcus (in: high G+C Gram-positive bacteria)]OZC63656.1 hypothetical protein CH277_22715 [Rhodococcus sp. 06-469-3-2]OZD40821.1 hypothetical protein CH264_24400 [Rhodococcus sp. 06-1477-1A]OZE67071.1 hypothetical protein CH306_25945 [Rhodococcus sp. 15-725-2-2b]